MINIKHCRHMHSRHNHIGCLKHIIVLCHRCNLTRDESQALKELGNNKNVTIRSADKGGAVVVLDSEIYKRLNLEMLGNKSIYTELSSDPTDRFKQELRGLLDLGVREGIFTRPLAEKMFIANPTVPVFHSLPKIHKEIFSPPLRPIVAGIGSLGEKFGSWLDHLLQPLVVNIPGYLWDTKQLIQDFEGGPWNHNMMWLTCDVTALYPSLSHDLSLKVWYTFLRKYSCYADLLINYMLVVLEFLLHSTFFCLTDNFISKYKAPQWGRSSHHL